MSCSSRPVARSCSVRFPRMPSSGHRIRCGSGRARAGSTGSASRRATCATSSATALRPPRFGTVPSSWWLRIPATSRRRRNGRSWNASNLRLQFLDSREEFPQLIALANEIVAAQVAHGQQLRESPGARDPFPGTRPLYVLAPAGRDQRAAPCRRGSRGGFCQQSSQGTLRVLCQRADA